MAPFLVAGVFTGSMLWWLFLTFIAEKLGHKIKPEHIDAVNRWFGIIIAIIGGLVLMGAVLK